MVRNIVTSATYRQSSKIRPDLQSKDPDNALLARQSRVRLPAELIRDEALYASGLLTLEVGGKSVKPPQPAGVASLAYGAKSDDSWVESKGDDKYRRGLYIHFQRATPYPLLMNFDAPKSVVAQCKREQSNTALQALNLLNDPVFVEAGTALGVSSDRGSAARQRSPGSDVRVRAESASDSHRIGQVPHFFDALPIDVRARCRKRQSSSRLRNCRASHEPRLLLWSTQRQCCSTSTSSLPRNKSDDAI